VNTSVKLTIQDMQALAVRKGGLCISNEYINAKTKLDWKCAEGHEWDATPNSIQRGSWCPACSRAKSGATQRSSIEDAKTFAAQKGGKCLSSEYKNNSQRLRWICAEGHEWEASLGSIKSGSWCSVCSQGVSERVCRVVLENGFGKLFPKARPEWLINERGNAMELDGYCEELGLAFEYNGRQHYSGANFFHRTDSALDQRIKDDETKAQLCRDHNIRLITIPYTVGIDGISDYVYQDLKPDFPSIEQEKFYWKPEEVYHSRSKLIELMNDIAEGHGGKCLSSAYVNMNTKLLWECSIGHQWEAVPSSIRQGFWCPRCGYKKVADAQRESIEDMQKLAQKKGGACLSSDYINSQQHLHWTCSEGHEWSALPNTIKKGHWCPICAKSGTAAKKSIEEFQAIAKERGGVCLSDEYLGIFKKLKWRCKEGHEWESTPRSIQIGNWCPKCGRIKVGNQFRKSIEDMQALAEKNGGVCLSDEYLNVSTKLKWRCKEGHEWESTPDNIQQGGWCPRCRRIEGWAKRRNAIAK
jgi:hypothetical protein